MKRFLRDSFFVAALSIAACTGSSSGPIGSGSDLAVPSDLTVADDQAMPADLAVGGPDRSMPPDARMPPDLATASDGPPPDLTVPNDLPMPPDMAVPPDIAVPPDLVTPPDLTRVLSFAAPLYFDVGQSPHGIVMGDWNGDGKPDAAVTVSNVNGSYLAVLINAGGAQFRPAVKYATQIGPQGVAALDVNGDGKLDLVSANAGVNVTTGSAFAGVGDGTFKPLPDIAAAAGGRWIATGDINGDNISDLVFACAAQNVNVLPKLKGVGNGTFTSIGSEVAGNSPIWDALADMNGDGKLDLVVLAQAGSVFYLVGKGDGTFPSATSYAVPPTLPMGGALGDWNADGKPDVAVANGNTPTVSVFDNIGAGALGARRDFNMPAGIAYAVTAGDFDRDGKLDLAAGNTDSVVVFTGKGNGDFNPSLVIPAAKYNYWITTADVDGDGRLDIITTNGNTGSMAVLRNTSAP